MNRYLNLIRNVRNWPLHFMDKFGLVKQDPLYFNLNNSLRVEVPKRIHHEFKEIFMENAYSIGLKKPVQEGSVIIDIGANVGFFSLFAAAKYKGCRILSYEPIKTNFDQLLKNKKLNATIEMSCFNEAVCGHKGSIKIFFDQNDSFSTSASILEDVNNENGDGFEEVPCLTLKDVFDKNKIDNCGLIKIDCEGAEYDILYNTPQDVFDKIDQMALELHECEGQDIASLKKHVADAGFELFEFLDKPHMLWAYKI